MVKTVVALCVLVSANAFAGDPGQAWKARALKAKDRMTKLQKKASKSAQDQCELALETGFAARLDDKLKSLSFQEDKMTTRHRIVLFNLIDQTEYVSLSFGYLKESPGKVPAMTEITDVRGGNVILVGGITFVHVGGCAFEFTDNPLEATASVNKPK